MKTTSTRRRFLATLAAATGAARVVPAAGATSVFPVRHKWGMVIDLRRCIGCHSCSIHCKTENEVPVGVYRAWVKYVDKGTYPNVRRNFLLGQFILELCET